LRKPQRDLYNLSVISGLRIGPKLTTASALDSMLSSPKVMVRCVFVLLGGGGVGGAADVPQGYLSDARTGRRAY